MSFDIKSTAKVSSGHTDKRVMQYFNYKGDNAVPNDDLATIKASGYFDTYANNLNIGDIMMLLGTDGSDIVRVTAVTPNVTVTSMLSTLPPGSVTLAELSAGITMSHIVKFAGQVTTAGGGAAESIVVTGALATDLAYVVVHTQGASTPTILQAQANTDAIDVTYSADPGADTQVTYQVLRLAV